jgi:hypothetical protein
MERGSILTSLGLRLPPGISPTTMGHKKMMEAMVEFYTSEGKSSDSPHLLSFLPSLITPSQELEKFQLNMLFGRSSKELGYLHHFKVSSMFPRQILWGPK